MKENTMRTKVWVLAVVVLCCLVGIILIMTVSGCDSEDSGQRTIIRKHCSSYCTEHDMTYSSFKTESNVLLCYCVENFGKDAVIQSAG